MTFSLTVKAPFPRPQSDGFPRGIQWQADGTPLGDRHVQTVNLVGFGTGGVTRDEDTLTVVGGGGGGGGGGSDVFEGASARKTADQAANAIIIFDGVASPRFNTGGLNVGTGVYTVQSGQAGLYRARASVQVTNSLGEGSPAFVAIDIVVNGATQVGHGELNVGDTAQIEVDSGIIILAEGDTVRAQKGSGNWSATVSVSAATYTHFTVERIGDTPSGG